MKRLQLTRPSPAMVLAAIALVLAMAGTAIAGPSAISSKITKSKVKQIAKKQINKAAPGLSVQNADNLGGAPAADYLKSANVRADGFASSVDIDNFTSAAFTSIGDKSFNAPAAGFAYVTASFSAEDDASFAGGGNMYYRLALDGTPVTDDIFYHQLQTSSANGIVGESGSLTDVIPVTAGAHTFSLSAREAGSGSFVLGRDISILFVPNGSSTAIPQKAGGGGGSNPQ
jgi:hypothetical protein